MVEVTRRSRLLRALVTDPFVTSDVVPRVPSQVDHSRVVLPNDLVTGQCDVGSSTDVGEILRLDVVCDVIRTETGTFARQPNLVIVHVVAGRRVVRSDFAA